MKMKRIKILIQVKKKIKSNKIELKNLIKQYYLFVKLMSY